ncbi:hypothetical protein HDU67_005814 [Dinochytrium kinnereticum]|nr:hypothetical protein HDU67_005814 [Dinochytrium kinnereticum]
MYSVVSRPISSLDLSPEARDALLQSGFKRAIDINRPSHYRKEFKDTVSLEAQEEIGEKLGTLRLQPKAVGHILARGISTSCTQLDAILGGVGIPMGSLTEVYGPPGIGLYSDQRMQLCANAQLLATNDSYPQVIYIGMGLNAL